MSSYHLDHLQFLETEAIHVMREVAAEFERPALLFSGGKDSICLLRLAEKAFRPSDIPMPFMNVETGHEFPELIEFRDHRAKELNAKLIIRTVDEVIARGLAHPAPGEISRNKLQSKIGSIQTVLVDEVTPEHIIARSKSDAPEIDGVVILPPTPGVKVGAFVEVEITDSDDYDLFASVVVTN